MTKQQIFDKVCKHLAKQGAQSKVPGEGAKYKIFDQDGAVAMSCSIGVLISEKVYNPNMEGLSVDELLSDKRFKLPAWMARHQIPVFLRKLQQIHDEARIGKMLRDGLEQLAKEHDLDPTELYAIRHWNYGY